MSRRIISALFTAAALSATPMLTSAQIIDTRPPSLQFFWQNFNSGGVILGQSFSTGSNAFLTNLTLYDVKVNSGQPLTYGAFVAEWNPGTRTTGSTVWSTSGSDLSTSFSNLIFAVNTQLNQSSTYLFGLVAAASGGNFFMGATPYSGGEFYFQSADNPTGVYSNQWAQYDLEISAELVPEPDTMVLLGSGLIGLIGVAVVRRQAVIG